MKTTAKITAVLLVLALAGSVSAAIITVEVTGVVDSVDTQGGIALDGSVIVGSTMTGYCTYDTETPDQNPSDDEGLYPVISISMTIGNYTFTHDPASVDSACFIVGVSDPVYRVYSPSPSFEGTIYVDGTPRTYDSVAWDWTYLKTIDLYTSSDEYITTDALPDLDSWPDLSIFDYSRSFRVAFSDSVPVGSGEGSFDIIGELTLLTVIPEPAKTYYVNATDGSDNNDGLSPETAFATIQKAIDSAFNGDTVLVADGTYTGPGNRDIDFLGKAITVKSESGPNNCIIDCESSGRGFNFHSGEGPNSVVSGFTITNGYASGPWPQNNGGGIFGDGAGPTIANCKVTGNTADYYGGGAHWRNNSNPKLINCEFTENTAGSGGGIFCSRGNPTIDNCVISRNSAVGRDREWSFGGGLDIAMSGGAITNCTITNNSSVEIGGGIYCILSDALRITDCTISGNSARDGGGISCRGSSPTLTNCIFIDNSGRGMSNYQGSSPMLIGCTFSGNSSGGMSNIWGSNPKLVNCIFSGNSTAYNGGGMLNDDSSPTVTNCTFSGNSAAYDGGGMYNLDDSEPTLIGCTFSGNLADSNGGGMKNERYSSPTITNCTFAGNSAVNGNGMACDSRRQLYPSNVQMTNCILWDGGSEIWNNDDSTISINYSDVQGGYVGEGNIDADPCFVEPGYWADANDPNIIVEPNDPNAVWVDGDYHLLRTSPCIDAGDPNYVAEPNETDIDGNPRVIDGRIDMGAYETNYIQAAMKLTPQMLNCNSKGKYVKAHLTLPEGFLPEDVDVNESAIAEPIGIESEYIKVLGTGPVRLEICFDRDAFCEAVTDIDDDSLEVTVIASLTTSRYFYATDTIKIKL